MPKTDWSRSIAMLAVETPAIMHMSYCITSADTGAAQTYRGDTVSALQQEIVLSCWTVGYSEHVTESFVRLFVISDAKYVG